MKEERIRQHISLLELSKRTKIPLRTLEDWESQKRKPRKTEAINCIAKVLCVSIQNFYTESLFLKNTLTLKEYLYIYYYTNALLKRKDYIKAMKDIIIETNQSTKTRDSHKVIDLNKITLKRKELDLTQVELAQKANISVRTIQSWYFSGTTPSFAAIYKIAKALKCPIESFFYDEILNDSSLYTVPINDFTLEEWKLLEIALELLASQCVFEESKEEIQTLLKKIKSYIINY